MIPANGGKDEQRQYMATGGSVLRPLAWLAATAAGLWLGGLIAFASSLPSEPSQPLRETDAIVVLTGGADRLNVGLDLLVQGRAQRLLVSGVDRGTTAAALQSLSRDASDKFACCVVLGHEAQDTVGNAMETALWVRDSGYHSIRLVTASYHMPRSLLLFQDAMPDMEIVPHPVFPAHVKQERWWQWPGTARLFASEFNKYLVSLLRVRLTNLAQENAAQRNS